MNTDKKPEAKDNINKMDNPNQSNWKGAPNKNQAPPPAGNPRRGNPFNLITIMFLITFLINIFASSIIIS